MTSAARFVLGHEPGAIIAGKTACVPAQAIAADPKNATLLASRAQAQIKLGDYVAAVESANQAVKLDPRNAKAQHRCGCGSDPHWSPHPRVWWQHAITGQRLARLHSTAGAAATVDGFVFQSAPLVILCFPTVPRCRRCICVPAVRMHACRYMAQPCRLLQPSCLVCLRFDRCFVALKITQDFHLRVTASNKSNNVITRISKLMDFYSRCHANLQ